MAYNDPFTLRTWSLDGKTSMDVSQLMLKIHPGGVRDKATFNADKLLYHGWDRWRLGWPYRSNFGRTQEREESRSSYVHELKAVAGYYGYNPDAIDAMLADGFSPDDIETMLYAGEL